ncbi:hypothetical protein [Arthrobacter sp. EpRS71]|uniref:hypothetical protein n=1 Tax=Arthrobacter sp. EpRS71 TaxID=1743141 RepID=UPI0012E350DE|nr:hypothetical protein [Arthrobacter sp. EpRS71]
MVKEAAGSGAGDGADDRRYGEQDLLLGKKVTQFISILCLIASIVCVLIAVFVIFSVPWDTKMPYDGKYNRSGNGIPMQVALFPALIPIIGFWRTAKHPKAHQMSKGGRIRAYLFVSLFVLLCVFLQAYFAQGILTAGGFFGG